MIPRKMLVMLAAVAALLPWTLAAQQKPSARDAFWSASDLISVTPNPAVHHHAAPRHHRATAAATSGASPTAVAQSEPPAQEEQASGVRNAVELVSANGYGAAPHLVSASESRLGLRCSVLLRGADGQYSEVPANSVFHSGDHIRLSFLANEPGYFYVIEQGSTGAWSPIFPPPHSSPDANRIAAGQLQVVPSGERAFAFDQNPGEEKLYVILSRTPIVDIDRAIQGLQGGQPAEQQHAPQGQTVLEAENRIPDEFVQALASRDLMLVDEQQVNNPSSGANGGEKAVYVVSKMNGLDGNQQVVLHLDLKHE